jgi:hypothetical protein
VVLWLKLVQVANRSLLKRDEFISILGSISNLAKIKIHSQERQKIMSQEMLSRKDAEAKLIAKAQADQSFRQALLTNSKAAIEQELGTIIEDFQVKVVEETADTLYLVLPAVETELSEDDLDSVAGGVLSTSSSTKKTADRY